MKSSLGTMLKPMLLFSLVTSITLFQYTPELAFYHCHLIYRGLYFIPVILAGFWLGLRGGLITSVGISMLFAPVVARHWGGLSPNDIDMIIEIALLNAVALTLGLLSDRECLKQKRLREAESLAAMGRAMSGVAHDMKSPLMAILGFTELVRNGTDKEHPNYQKLNLVLQQAHRLDHLTKDMLDFARPLDLQRTPQDINEVVGVCLLTVIEEARKREVDIREELAPGLPPIALDGPRIERVLINLMMNAVEASPEGEKVVVCTSRSGNGIIIDISDHGSGIPAPQKSRIFDPFFTTKKGGTGLGLPIARKIIEAHEGQLLIVNNPEKGVTLRAVLPV